MNHIESFIKKIWTWSTGTSKMVFSVWILWSPVFFCLIYKSVNLHCCILSLELSLVLLKASVFTNLIRNAEKSMSCPDMARHVCWCCFISLNQLLAFESSTEDNLFFGTGKQREIFSLQDDCNSLCLFVYSNAYVYNVPPTWLVIFTVLWFSIGLQWLQLHPWSQAHSTEHRGLNH